MKSASRYQNLDIINDDAPMYRVKFYNFMYACGSSVIDIYRKYDAPASYEDAYHKLCSAVREIEELAFANDGRVEALNSPEMAHVGNETLYVSGWDKFNDEYGLPVRRLWFDSEVNDFELETTETYTNWAYAWIEKVA